MRYRTALFCMLGLMGLGACADVAVPHAKSTTGRPPEVAEVPEKDETVRGEDDPAIVTLDFSQRFAERRLSRSDELPGAIIVPNTNLNGVPVATALQAVLHGTDVSVSWETGDMDNRLVTVTNLSGSLPVVVNKICSAAKVFCGVRNGLLEIKEKETFVIELPAMPLKIAASSSSSSSSSSVATTTAANTMAEAISDLAASKARLDQQGGNLIYETDVEGQERVRQYLEQLRNGRPLIVLQLYIWEVGLDKGHGTGINWKNFKMSKIGGDYENLVLSGSSGFGSMASPGVSLGATLAGKINAENVLQFLSTQGQVQTISNPQLTFVSGSNAEFRVGGKQRYISQVGQSNNNTTSSSSTSVSTNTVSTDSLETGLTVTVNGLFESGIISAAMELMLQDVVSLNPTKVEDLVVDLPETSERKVSTTLRVRPGDNLVLAGLVSSRDANDRDYIPLPFGGRLPTFSKDQYKNTELVVFVKPSVVLFSDSGKMLETRSMQKYHQVGASASLAEDATMPAVLIDKDGAKSLAVPSVAAPTAQAQMQRPISLAPSVAMPSGASDAPVDKTLLQRGFSHAFDEMMAPTNGAAGAR